MAATTTQVTLRLPDHLIEEYKREASISDVPYQRLMRSNLGLGLEAYRKATANLNRKRQDAANNGFGVKPDAITGPDGRRYQCSACGIGISALSMVKQYGYCSRHATGTPPDDDDV